MDRMAQAIGANATSLRHLVSPESATSGPSWARRTAHAQTRVVRTAIETLRKLKHRPTGGFCLFYLADPTPAGGFGILDHDRKPKPSWEPVTNACKPVVVVADPLPPVVRANSRHRLAIHVVSDLHVALVDGEISATITDAEANQTVHRWGGAVGPDCVEHVANLSIEPVHRGELLIELTLTATGPDGPVTHTNTYRTLVN